MGPDLKPLIIMPSEFFNKFCDNDLSAIIVYLKSVAPVDNEQPESTLRVLGRIILLFEPNFLPSTLIDHAAPRPPSPALGVTREYGEYLATICTVCHGENLGGGTVPGEGPEAPKAPNLTPAGPLAAYSEDSFKATLRSGSTPTESPLDKEFMPWNRFKDLTDEELSTVPPVEIE